MRGNSTTTEKTRDGSHLEKINTIVEIAYRITRMVAILIGIAGAGAITGVW
jgi:energy-converting hydrogenase Eha subunit H